MVDRPTSHNCGSPLSSLFPGQNYQQRIPFRLGEPILMTEQHKRCCTHGASLGSCLPRLVGGLAQCLCRVSLHMAPIINDPSLRPMGSSLAGPQNSRTFVFRKTFSTHQCQIEQFTGLSSLPATHYRQKFVCCYRQYCCHVFSKHVFSSLLFQEVIQLWKFCIVHSMNLEVSYLSEAQNELADRLSRTFSSHHKWSLHPDVVRGIFL